MYHHGVPIPDSRTIHVTHTGAGEVGLRLSNQGAARATITEVYMVDEAGLLRPETARVESTGQVHFRKATKGESRVKFGQAAGLFGCFG